MGRFSVAGKNFEHITHDFNLTAEAFSSVSTLRTDFVSCAPQEQKCP